MSINSGHASIELTDNSEEILKLFREAVIRGLEQCGMKAAEYAADIAPYATGNLKQSIRYDVDTNEPAAYVGTNCEYAVYQELGTGKYYPGGRKTPWSYEDEYGNEHWTAGNKPHPFLKPAVEDHKQTYRNIIEDELKHG